MSPRLPQGAEPSIFISYSMEDGKEAAVLHRLLTLLGFRCFLAHLDIRKGEPWRKAILRELRESDVFLVLLSDDGVKSPWVQQECGMAHLLFEQKRRPLIVPVTPNGKTPPGCLSEYQAQAIGQTFWLGKLAIETRTASTLAKVVIEHVRRGAVIRPRAISSLKGSTVEDFSFIVGFLSSVGVTFQEFLAITNQAISHAKAGCSDQVMGCMYKLLEAHRAEFEKFPDWVKAWNGLHKKYQDFKEAERRLQEEVTRAMLKAVEPKAASNSKS